MRSVAAAGLAAVACALTACGASDDLGPALETTPPAALPSRFYPPEGWTWGLLQVGDHPPHRYGVAGPRRASRGHVIILPGLSEPAEKWFETASALVAADWTVWILDPAGQGGSARSAPPRDMAHVRDMAVDEAALRELIVEIIRPMPQERVVVLAHSLGAATTLLALADGLPEVDAAVLSAPVVATHPDRMPMQAADLLTVSVWARRLGLGGRYAAGQDGWSSSEVTGPPVTHDPVRARVQTEWMRTNPALRVGGVSWAWTAAALTQQQAARSPGTLARVTTPVTVLAPSEDAWAAPGSQAALCAGLARCTLVPLAGSRHELHMEIGTSRDRWLAAVLAAAEGAPLPEAARPR